jgi:hypothetical protein
MALRKRLREFCAQQKDLRRVTNPYEQQDQRTRSTMAGFNPGFPEIKAYCELAKGKEKRGNECANPYVPPRIWMLGKNL